MTIDCSFTSSGSFVLPVNSIHPTVIEAMRWIESNCLKNLKWTGEDTYHDLEPKPGLTMCEFINEVEQWLLKCAPTLSFYSTVMPDGSWMFGVVASA